MNLDHIIATLADRQQRATYGCIASLLGRTANGLMQNRVNTPPNSWVVAANDRNETGARRGWPTGYADNEMDPRCLEQCRANRDDFIETEAALRQFLEG